MLAGIFTLGYTKAELKVERLQQLASEEMPFDHPEFVDRLPAHGKFNSANVTEIMRELSKAAFHPHDIGRGCRTYVAPTVFSFKNWGVN